MEACPQCGAPYGKRRRCYKCNGRARTGEWKACHVCKRQKYFQVNQLANGEGLYCSVRCKHESMRGKDFVGTPHYETKPLGSTRKRKDGYIEVKVGRDQYASGWELEHRFMMALLLGRTLEKSEEVHHKDEDRSHNCPGNLEVQPNGEHQRLHNKLHSQSRKVLVTCALDGCEVVMLRKLSRSAGDCYCSNEHRLDAMHAKAREYHTDRRERLGYGSEPLSYISYGPSWLAAREACRQRDGRTCQHCGLHEDILGEHVQAAHIIPFRSFPSGLHEVANRLENLISLCRSCHMKHDIANGLH